MEQFLEDDEINLMLIKKKPKLQKSNNTNFNLKQQQCFKKSIDKTNLKRMDLKIQASLFDSLIFNENVQPDFQESCLKIDFTEWEHQNFVFKLRQQSQNSKIEYDDKTIQYFSDFNQKWNIYPYKHFVDLKPEIDYVITKQPLQESQRINIENQGQNQIKIIPLKQNEKLGNIKIK